MHGAFDETNNELAISINGGILLVKDRQYRLCKDHSKELGLVVGALPHVNAD